MNITFWSQKWINEELYVARRIKTDFSSWKEIVKQKQYKKGGKNKKFLNRCKKNENHKNNKNIKDECKKNWRKKKKI